MQILPCYEGLLRIFESDADAPLFAPDDPAGQVTTLRYQGELRRDPDRACDVECRAGCGEIANRAGDRAAAELDGSALQDLR